MRSVRLAVIVGVAALGAAAMALVSADSPASARAHHRGKRFQNNYVEFEPNGLGALLKWRIESARAGLPQGAATARRRDVEPDLAFVRAQRRRRPRRWCPR